MKSIARQKLLFATLLFGALAALTPRASAQGGVPLWTNRCHGPGNGDDFVHGLTTDSSGNVFVTGLVSGPTGWPSSYYFGTVKYSSSGLPLWTNYYGHLSSNESRDRPFGIVADSNGNVCVTGWSTRTNVGPLYNADYATVAYSDSGVPLWTNRYARPESSADDIARAIAVDDDGNLFVTGSSIGTGTGYDYVTIAYSSDGVPLWTNRYDGLGNDDDAAYAVAVSSNGQVFVTGYSTGTNGHHDYATVAYSGAGESLWTNRYRAGLLPFDDEAAGASVDNHGDVVVTGLTKSGSGYEYVTIKYSSSGVPLWTNRYSKVARLNYPRNQPIAVDSVGNVFVTGISSNGASWDYVTIKYSSDGLLLWTNHYNGPGNDDDTARAVAVDGSDNIFVTGYSGTNFLTLAYSTSGVPLWTNRSLAGAGDVIALDGNGNVIVAGRSQGSNGDLEFVTIKYSAIPPPPAYLSFQLLYNGLVLSWTNAGFSLQTAPASTGTFTNLPGATSPYTNPITTAHQFFRLKKN